jgi:hypothetical protein
MAYDLLNLEPLKLVAEGIRTVGLLMVEIAGHNALVVDGVVKVVVAVQVICAVAVKLSVGNDAEVECVTFVAVTESSSEVYMKGKAMEASLEMQMTTTADWGTANSAMCLALENLLYLLVWIL